LNPQTKKGAIRTAWRMNMRLPILMNKIELNGARNPGVYVLFYISFFLCIKYECVSMYVHKQKQQRRPKVYTYEKRRVNKNLDEKDTLKGAQNFLCLGYSEGSEANEFVELWCLN